MDTIPQIKAAVRSFQNDIVYQKLRTRWQTDFDLYRKKPYDAGSGYYSYTTALPGILVNKGISMVTESKLYIRVPEETLRQDERIIASNIERLHYGMINIYDERMLQLDKPTFIEQLAWHSIVRGGYAARPYVYKNDKGETIVDFAVWDLYNTAYAQGANGTLWAAYKRMATKEEAEDTWKVKLSGKPSKEVEVIDFWDTKNNAVIVGNQWAKEPKAHGLDYCPVYIIHAGAMPPVSQDNYTYTNVHIGESILAGFRLGYPMLSKLISDYASIVRRGIKVPLGIWSAGAQREMPEDIYQVDKGATIQLDSNANEKIEPLIKPTMPADAAALLGIISNEEQLAGMSHIALGQLSFRLSGFAVNTLISQILEVVTPFLVCAEKGIQSCCRSAIQQYANGNFAPLKVRGRTSRSQPFGMPQAQVIAPDDIKGDWLPEIKLLPTLPKDDAQRFELGQIARRNQFMAMSSIRDSLIGIEDPDFEQEKMDKEWADELIINKLYKAYMAAVKDGDDMVAENIRMELIRVMRGQREQQPRPQGEEQGRLAQETMGLPGAGIPAEETGLSAETYPSEMAGGFPGGAVNARLPVEGIG